MQKGVAAGRCKGACVMGLEPIRLPSAIVSRETVPLFFLILPRNCGLYVRPRDLSLERPSVRNDFPVFAQKFFRKLCVLLGPA